MKWLLRKRTIRWILGIVIISVLLGAFTGLLEAKQYYLSTEIENGPGGQFRGEKWVLPLMLDPKLRQIMTDLIQCESGGNEQAVNENDLDNSPSYGLLQFKPGTLYSEGVKYGILQDIEPAEIMNRIFEGQLQIDIFLKMYEKDGKKENFWLQQFPGCFNKYRQKWGI